jgi:hypothetical protein
MIRRTEPVNRLARSRVCETEYQVQVLHSTMQT